MTPHFSDDWLTVYAGDCRAVLPTLEAESVDCIVTSPPYWGLRDYGTEGQLGLEPTPVLYVANLVAVFRELRRVLKPSGTCWLNLGDSYNNRTKVRTTSHQPALNGFQDDNWAERAARGGVRMTQPGVKEKDLVGIPWRVAFALQADGWYLRSDIIWSKPNPMPESVTDRPTKAHEYLFLLTKSARYFYDAEAVREAVAREWDDSIGGSLGGTKRLAGAHIGGDTREQRPVAKMNPAGRNLRSVWTIATRPYPGAHFAVFPPELPERCIKAGSSERGVCPECEAPWGWYHIAHASAGAVPAVILDPFAGSGTVGLVANRLSRRAILIDLNPDYVTQQMRRNAQTPLGLGA